MVDLTPLNEVDIDCKFIQRLRSYLVSVAESQAIGDLLDGSVSW